MNIGVSFGVCILFIGVIFVIIGSAINFTLSVTGGVMFFIGSFIAMLSYVSSKNNHSNDNISISPV